jgi:pimeloyl-ACP methyl ester carboxylesterase
MPSNSLAFQAPSLALLATEPLRAVLDLFASRLGHLPTVDGDGHPVIVYPGLGAGPLTTSQLRSHLKQCDFTVHDWELGVNTGPEGELDDWLQPLAERVRALHALHGRKVSLVGWSLGGVYARGLAVALPAQVRSVITLGSPFVGDTRASNARHLYRLLNGLPAERDGAFRNRTEVTPTVPCTSIYSRSDGVVAWQTSIEKSGPQSESIEVVASHAGLGVNPAVLYAVADRLAQPEGAWKPFRRDPLNVWMYPEPAMRADG